MTSLNPSAYDREDTTTPFFRIRYSGTCDNCERTVQATPLQKQTAKGDAEWVRCTDCGQVTLCEQAATANHHGGTDR